MKRIVRYSEGMLELRKAIADEYRTIRKIDPHYARLKFKASRAYSALITYELITGMNYDNTTEYTRQIDSRSRKE